MKRRLGCLLAASFVVFLGIINRALSQDLPAAPVPVQPPIAPPAATGNQPQMLPAPPQAGGPLTLPPPPPLGLTPPLVAPYQDNIGPLLRGDPLLDRPQAAPGLFAGLELDVLAPHIRNRLVGS